MITLFLFLQHITVKIQPRFPVALSKSTTRMAAALEIGEAADQYLAEGKYDRALEKFQSSLSVLVPLLGKEPPGRRRDLLHKQVSLEKKTFINVS